MSKILLAGDVGASKADLALYAIGSDGSLRPLRGARLPTREAASLPALLERFLGKDSPTPVLVSLGVAGPVVDGVARGVNLPFEASAAELAAATGSERVQLLNDLEAMAYGTLFVEPSQVTTLHAGRARDGNRGVIAAGTGLGQAFLFFDGERYHPCATEGGHVDFAPRDELEFGLLQYLKPRYGRVSYERVLSGPGLYHLFSYLVEELGRSPSDHVRRRIDEGEDPNAVVGEAGVSGQCAVCEEAVGRFVSFYGTQAGNLALTVMATGGVWVGGGIVTRIVAKLASGGFLDAFRSKGRYVSFMEEIPVHVLLDPHVGLRGAAHAGRDLLLEGRVCGRPADPAGAGRPR